MKKNEKKNYSILSFLFTHIMSINNSDQLFNILDKILNKINTLDERLTNMEKKIDLVSSLAVLPANNNICVENLKELKKENLICEKNNVFEALKYRDYRSIIYIFKHFYKNKSNENCAYPLKIKGKRSFEYYDNKKWNHDLYGHYSINVIFLNIQNLFIRHNILDSEITSEDFLLNQEFISKLSNEKYKKDIFKNIIEEIRINNI